MCSNEVRLFQTRYLISKLVLCATSGLINIRHICLMFLEDFYGSQRLALNIRICQWLEVSFTHGI